MSSWEAWSILSALPNLTAITEALAATTRILEMIDRVPSIETENRKGKALSHAGQFWIPTVWWAKAANSHSESSARGSKILLLDEATSALDAQSEKSSSGRQLIKHQREDNNHYCPSAVNNPNSKLDCGSSSWEK
ncbi:hypothetical protein J5N97_000439 [Dioscorea zingiberensis]|uniref:Uncharacterized protein n=1 Tax=Dioscorea zingiberensis TaxID=325984 RepID=A0A9D5H1G3_9LILI|nr:hypothetical protein J5N97_000439 [Dioscorea zingiberensis]